jgi:hypothetical protein
MENAVTPLLFSNRVISIIRSEKSRDYFATGFFLATKPFTPKKKPKKEVHYFWKHQKSISDYDKVFENSIPFGKKDLLQIKILEYRKPGLSTGLLLFVPWHRDRGCLGAAAPVTGEAADDDDVL